ncbi:MAG: hypothetical protein QCI82_10910, partial [Candidatus Thermoplasmatota archaeon]|nr:hypothetical protein [Candidatus Thermoplasmatota archaeon]
LLDPDIDGDGVPNEIDPDPYDPNVYNLPPTGLQSSVDPSMVKEGDTFTLSATATDPNSDPLTYTWTVDKVPAWSRTGQSVEVEASGDLKSGSYVFTVTVSDGKSAESPTDTVQVTIEETKKTDNTIMYIIVAAVILIVILIVAFFLMRKKPEEEGEVEEILPDSEPMGLDVTEDDVEEYPAPELEIPPGGEMLEEEEEIEDVEVNMEDVEDLEALANELDMADACPECGFSLGPSDTKCPGCGVEFDLEMECPNCASAVPEGSNVCPGCGAKFS